MKCDVNTKENKIELNCVQGSINPAFFCLNLDRYPVGLKFDYYIDILKTFFCTKNEAKSGYSKVKA